MGGDEVEGDSSCLLILMKRSLLSEAECREVARGAVRRVEEGTVEDGLGGSMSKAHIFKLLFLELIVPRPP
eukprot:CAMPEP_0171411456 /NCGR_PEP_ID=MMETSP0880-20121228/30139_1 /TAXON_ID=67004 /ORGANISM="Thalassiosira weissflogii, Strain CCMP1336" /LENGTH=70 /DNA_ID=CAMNT_0011928545 /DNA_START=67 /DNA_END=276 /DNA_ORIENTATION=-